MSTVWRAHRRLATHDQKIQFGGQKVPAILLKEPCHAELATILTLLTASFTGSAENSGSHVPPSACGVQDAQSRQPSTQACL